MQIVTCTAVLADEIDFGNEVRPILARHCFRCHGQDAEHREAGLRLDERVHAIAETDGGSLAVVPGHPEASELVARIVTEDDDLRMPPAETGERLTEPEIAIIRKWISAGARYSEHWSFVPPRRWPVPTLSELARGSNLIDAFVRRRLEAEGLRPNTMASSHDLIRRLSLDLRGLPPSPVEVVAFVGDASPVAYERLVDRFLQDPGFGERWARVWLDLARYADSRGYGSDPLRMNMWRYRDWVIDAFNDNVPYDQFTVEQMAGDLLPDPTLRQRMATAFHRNTMTNVEGGTDDEEFRVAAVKDRIETTFQVWMGLTMQCANCHDHKYDPISQEEYYRFYAIFNQTADSDRPDEYPTIEAPTELLEIQMARIDAEIAAMNSGLETARQQAKEQVTTAPPQPITGRIVRVELSGENKILSLAEVEVFAGDSNSARQGKPSQSSTSNDAPAELAIDGNTNGNFFQAMSTTHTNSEKDPWWEVELSEATRVDRIVVWNRTDGNVGSRLANLRIRLLDQQRERVWQFQLGNEPQTKHEISLRPMTAAEQEVARLEGEVLRLEASKPDVPTLPVLAELPTDKQRETLVMVRGNFLDRSTQVEPGLPSTFTSSTMPDAPGRLDAARWLVAGENPLTARVAVNRIWAQLFGIGLVETEEDFGTQGEPPSHPQLLDWLATEYQELGWDTKRLLRLIVTSDTYRQNSALTSDVYQRDPRNRLLSRGPRFRLEAETLRDQALALSGLLTRQQHGPSVYPYQPPGMWRAAFNGQRKWPTSEGADKYRRGLYTFWRRTVPYPSMQTFDAPSREICTVRRLRTNTPLQALVTLNDPAYVEAAQALARRIFREAGPSVEQRVRYGLELCLSRPPQSAQVERIKRLFDSELQHFRQHSDAAEQMATDPLGPLNSDWDAAELAAWTVVANVLLNLDAVLTKG
jgi:hypothetical protein